MAVTTTKTNKPLNPRGNDQSPLAFNRAKLYSGKALDFDGVNDSVSVPYSDTLGGVWSWVSIIEADALSGYQELFGGMYSGSNATIYLKENQLTIYTNQDNLNTAFDFETGKKYHIACSQSGDTISVYVNGQSAGSVSLTIPLNSTSGTYIIGKRPNQANEYFNGKMSGVKLFNTALTAAQVADLYNNPEKVVPTGVDNTALKLWLPMMEGAGTTAYDGSGNANHGTISGATYVNGVGAPVSQSAVIDWNKGTNILEYSIWNNSYWTASGGVVTDGIEAPDGTNTAFKFERDNAISGTIYSVSIPGLDGTNYRYVYAKLPSGSASASAQLLSHNSNTNNTFTITDEWQRFEVNSAPNTAPTNFYIVDFRGGVGVDEIHLWAPQAAAGTDESVFVPTIGTAQSSPVLLPQGLTTGRDITGVNLFENVRKQGALNLDGNSWAEVHDNASLDITTAITLEAWVYWDAGVDKGILGRWQTSGNKRSYLLYKLNDNNVSFYISSDGTGANQDLVPFNVNVSNGWQHIVGVYDGSNLKSYLNGVLTNSVATSLTEIDANDHSIEIGRYFASIGSSYPNDIAQPRIYNRALTAEEVQRSYDSGKNIYTNS